MLFLKNKTTHTFVGLYIVCFAMVLFQGCILVTNRTVVGSVLGPNERTIGQAVITTDPPTESVFTDSLGRFTLKIPASKEYIIKAYKAGYRERQVTINANKNDVIRADIQLEVDKTDLNIEFSMPDTKPYAEPLSSEKKGK